MQYRVAYTNKSGSSEIEIPLIGESGTGSDFVGYIHRMTFLHTAGSATTWSPTVFDAPGATAGGDHEVTGVASANVTDRVNENAPAPIMFYSEDGSLYVQLGYDTGADNNGIIELYVTRADTYQRM